MAKPADHHERARLMVAEKFRNPDHIPMFELKRLIPATMTVSLNLHGEYRVNFKGGSEATAYYTDDVQDALGTARAMAAEGDRTTGTKYDERVR